ncbi:MAG TPA: hypothetical protein VGL94_02910 [Ktedonobacteraceae bacterium]
MKHRKSWYIFVAFAVCVLVACSVLLPGVLLSKTEDSALGDPHTVSVGNPSSQQNEANGASKPSQPAILSKQLTEHVQMFVQSAAESTLSKEYANGSMGMNETVEACIRQITLLMSKGTILSLDGFPQAYTVSAEARTLTNVRGNSALQYWNVVFIAKADQSTDLQKVAVTLDAQLGIMLSLHITIASDNNTVDLVNTAEAIAQDMNIPGKLLSLNQQQVPQTALWGFNDSLLLMRLTLTKRADLTSLFMTLDVNEPLPAPVPG